MKLGNIVLATAIVLGLVVLVGLGTWQVKRLVWKQALIDRVEANLSASPLSGQQIATMVEGKQDIEYRPVSVSGTFRHDLEQHYFATFKGSPGYFVYTPLRQDDGQFVFVNRGYVPLSNKQSDSRAGGLIKERITIDGLARSAPEQKPNSFVPDNDLDKNIYYWKSLAQMTQKAFGRSSVRVAPYFVDAGANPTSGGLPVGGVTRIEFPNSHLQYAITWYGLALTLLIVGGYFLFGRVKAS